MLLLLSRRPAPSAPQERHSEAAQYNFFPLTYVVPSEYRMFVEEFRRSAGTWIMKPIGKAQGAGIFLFNKLNQVRQEGGRGEQGAGIFNQVRQEGGRGAQGAGIFNQVWQEGGRAGRHRGQASSTRSGRRGAGQAGTGGRHLQPGQAGGGQGRGAQGAGIFNQVRQEGVRAGEHRGQASSTQHSAALISANACWTALLNPSKHWTALLNPSKH